MSLKRSGLILLLASAAIVSCSQQPEQSSPSQEMAADSARAPDIAPSAAPGVAFAYGYNFQLPDKRISEVQEGHARECEQLGLAKCRITGMTYGIDENEQVSGSLRVKLNPAIARSFGKQAWGLVEKSDGRLVNLQISGDDVGSGIDAAQRRRSELSQRITDLEKKLAALPAADPGRSDLISQIEALKEEIGGQQRAIDSGQDQLANTPMTFDYYGSGGVPGFRGNPIREAWHTLVATVVITIRFLLQALAVVLPLALLVGLLILIWRSAPIRWLRRWLWENGVSSDS